jgi:hypothetical protein
VSRTIINVYSSGGRGFTSGIKIAGAFTKERALSHAKRIAGKGARLARRGDELGYSGGSPDWVYIKLSEIPS